MSTYLIDTNVVIRLAEPTAPEHPVVKAAVLRLVGRQDALVLAPQVLIEMWVVATRPTDVNGFGWSPPDASAAIAGLRQQFTLLDDAPDVFHQWLTLVERVGVRGKRAHDARIAAFMSAHRIPNVLTLNPSDFVGFPGVVAVHPGSLPTS